MSMEVKIPTQEIENLIKKFAEAEGIYDEYARPAMEEAVAYILAKVVQKTPADTGILRGSIQSEIRGRSLNMQGIVATSSDYAPAVEYGLPVGHSISPLDSLQRWVEHKGITYTTKEGRVATSRQIAYMIARVIQKKGTTGKAMFQTSMDESERFVLDLFDKVNVRFLERFK